MQSDLGKLFIGGISWDTNEERLKEYFRSYGEILEAVIMKDHTTGRARGFGFIVFSDPVVAERVTKEKHNIDGRMVEAKKAVPRDDQSPISRNSLSIQGSPGPGPGRTRKIFVGGLASTVTETDFKCYFERYGTITDVVVMYDHSTQRPRGFGFITFDSEEAVEKVLLKTFHELNGKMVEVKRAVPKELSPGPIRSPIGPYPYGLTCASNLFNGRFSPIPSGRNGFAAFGSGYGMGLNFEPGVIGNGYNSIPGYGRGMGMGMGPYYVGNSGRFGNPVGFENGNGVNTNTSFFSSNNQNLWSNNNGLNYTSNSTGSTGVIGGGILGNTGLNWGPSPISPHGSVNGLVNGSVNGLVNGSTQSGNFGYGGTDGSYGLRGSVYGRNGSNNSVGPTSSFGGSNVGLDGPFSDFYGGNGSGYGGDPSWQEGSGSFGGYGLGDVQSKNSSGYVGGYSVAKRQENRGIAG